MKHVANFKIGQRVKHLKHGRIGTVVELGGETTFYSLAVDWDGSEKPNYSAYTQNYAHKRLALLPGPRVPGLAGRGKRRMRI